MTELGPPDGWEGQPETPGKVGLVLEGRPPTRAWLRYEAAEGDELAERLLLKAAQGWATHLSDRGLLMGEGRVRRDGPWLVIDAALEVLPP